ncbi:MAG: protein kinase [Proteobacteria bacterium]|nr:protein kinase [Pseudomonadota bacterium]
MALALLGASCASSYACQPDEYFTDYRRCYWLYDRSPSDQYPSMGAWSRMSGNPKGSAEKDKTGESPDPTRVPDAGAQTPVPAERFAARASEEFNAGNFASAQSFAREALRRDPKNDVAGVVDKLLASRDAVTAAKSMKLPDNREHQEALRRPAEGQSAAAGEPRLTAARPAPHAATPQEVTDTMNQKATASLLRDSAAKLEVGDKLASIRAATKAIERSPKSAEAYNQRAVALIGSGLFKPALADAEAALKLSPGNRVALNYRGFARVQLHDDAGAIEDAERVLAIDPKDAHAYVTLALAHRSKGELREMLKAYWRAASLNAKFKAVYENASRDAGYAVEPLAMGTNSDVFLKALAGGPDLKPSASAPPPARVGRWALLLAVLAGALLGWPLVRRFGGRGSAAEPLTPGAMAITVRADAAAEPELLDSKFRLGSPIGRGGMGVVYAAEDVALQRRVAVKKMRDEIKQDAAERRRFVSEARIVANLHHASIVEIHSIVEQNDDLYLVFEYVEGVTLHERLREKGLLSLEEVKRVVKPVAKALSYAHARGVIHRDLKPSNVMLTGEGDVKVMDFGIARKAKEVLSKQTMTNTIVGTPLYMAPEAESGVVRKESDVYALAVMTYELLTGRPPFPAPSSVELKLAKRYVPPSKAISGLPRELDALMSAGLEPDPDRRLRSASQFWERLKAIEPSPSVT